MNSSRDKGIVLLITLALLVIMATLGYTISSKFATDKHRSRYIIDYTQAKYGCESALQYAVSTLLKQIKPQLISRPNEPDFSDIFAMDKAGYQKYLQQWFSQHDGTILPGGSDNSNLTTENNSPADKNNLSDGNSVTEKSTDELTYRIRGPYGPVWPCVTEPVEFEIGDTKIKIELEDENAKYPLGWLLLDKSDVQREIDAGFQSFCEWMQLSSQQIEKIRDEITQMAQLRTFSIDFRPTTEIVKYNRSTTIRTGSKSRKMSGTRSVRKKVTTNEQVSRQDTDFAMLFHSSLIDSELFMSNPAQNNGIRRSALKYIGLYGSRKVNINTAPRHVLEAALSFSGDAVELAEQIIQRRQVKPFADIKELKASFMEYSDAIEKCSKYITTQSDYFIFRITAVAGVAKVSAVAVVSFRDGRLKPVMVMMN